MPLLFSMKIKRYLNAFLTLIGFAIIGWFSFIRPDLLLLLGIFTSISGYFLLFICFTPVGNLTLGNTPPLSLSGWLGKMLKAQGVLLLVTIAATGAFFGAGPFFAQGNLPFEFVTSTIWDYSRVQWGIFPWGIYGLWGLVISYVTYVKKGVPYLYQIAQGFVPKRLEGAAKTFIEGTSSGATMIAFSLVVSSIILLIAYAIENIFRIQHFAVPFVTIFVLSFATTIFSFKTGRKFFRRFFRKMTLNKLYSFIILFIIAALIISALGNKWFIQNHSQLYQNTICHHCGNYFSNVPLEARFAAIYWGWWLIWTPICGSYLASISQGRTIRQFVLGLYGIPIVFFILLYYLGKPFLLGLHAIIQHFNPSVSLFLLAALTWVVFSKMIQHCETSEIFVSGYMPVPENLKRNRVWLHDASKILGIKKYAQKILMMVIAVIFLHTTAGWYGIQLQVAAMGAMVILAVYNGFNFIFLRFFKDKVWIGNKNIPPFH